MTSPQSPRPHTPTPHVSSPPTPTCPLTLHPPSPQSPPPTPPTCLLTRLVAPPPLLQTPHTAHPRPRTFPPNLTLSRVAATAGAPALARPHSPLPDVRSPGAAPEPLAPSLRDSHRARAPRPHTASVTRAPLLSQPRGAQTPPDSSDSRPWSSAHLCALRRPGPLRPRAFHARSDPQPSCSPPPPPPHCSPSPLSVLFPAFPWLWQRSGPPFRPRLAHPLSPSSHPSPEIQHHPGPSPQPQATWASTSCPHWASAGSPRILSALSPLPYVCPHPARPPHAFQNPRPATSIPSLCATPESCVCCAAVWPRHETPASLLHVWVPVGGTQL